MCLHRDWPRELSARLVRHDVSIHLFIIKYYLMNNEFTGNMDLLDGYDRAMTATKHKLGDAML